MELPLPRPSEGEASNPASNGYTWKSNETPSLETGLHVLNDSELQVSRKVKQLEKTLFDYEGQIVSLKEKILLVSLESEKRVRNQAIHFNKNRKELEEQIQILRNDMEEMKVSRLLEQTHFLPDDLLHDQNQSMQFSEAEVQDSVMDMDKQQLMELVRVLRQQVIIYVQDFTQEREARAAEKGKQDKLRAEILIQEKEMEAQQAKREKLEKENQSLRKDREFLKYQVNKYQQDIARLKKVPQAVDPAKGDARQIDLWFCTSCTYRNPAESGFCQACGKPKVEKVRTWICRACSHDNQLIFVNCEACGREDKSKRKRDATSQYQCDSSDFLSAM